jgi:hypothetical protein
VNFFLGTQATQIMAEQENKINLRNIS